MKNIVRSIGSWSGIIAFVSVMTYEVVQLLQIRHVISYPADEILIYSASLCIVIPFIIEMLALHYTTPKDKQFWSHGALIFTVMYAVFVTANYVVQLGTVIPMKLKGNGSGVQVLEQTPHSLFWDFDALGYILMGLAMFIAVPAFHKKGFAKYVRLAFLANGLVTPFIAIVYFYPDYSEQLLRLGYPWAVTAPLSMLLLAVQFKKEIRQATAAAPDINLQYRNA